MSDGRTALRAAIYARVSTEEQAKEGTSLDTQVERCSAFITSKGWNIEESFVDEGESGAHHSRPQLDRLMAACRAGTIEAVVVTKLDRFSRSARHLLNAVGELDDLGVVFAAVHEAFDSSTASGRMLRTLLGGVAEFEREQIRERSSSGLRKTAEQGRWPGGPPPFGFMIAGEGRERRLAIDEDEARTIRKAVSLMLDEGCTTWETAAALRALGAKTRKDTRWDHSNLRRTLQSETLDGRWRYSKSGQYQTGGPIEVGIPAILTPARFVSLQKVLASTSTGPRKNRHVYPLSGRLFGICGGPFHGVYRRDRQLRQYRCRGSRPEAAVRCVDKRLMADDIEEVVWGAVTGLLGEPNRLLAMAEDFLGLRGAEVVLEHDQLETVDARIANLNKALGERAAEALKAGVPASAIKAAAEQLETELAALHRHRNQIESWRRTTAQASDRVRQLWELAETAHARLGDLSVEEEALVLDLLDVRVTVSEHATRSAPARVRIEGTVFDELLHSGLEGELMTGTDGNLADVAPHRLPRATRRARLVLPRGRTERRRGRRARGRACTRHRNRRRSHRPGCRRGHRIRPGPIPCRASPRASEKSKAARTPQRTQGGIRGPARNGYCA